MASEIDLGVDQLTDAVVIGRGGFSTVYAATDTQFDRRVAVKVLRELSKESDRNRFESECRVMGRLSSHQNVVTLYHAGYTADDEPYMIMELNEEGSLADLLKAEGTLRWQRALELMIPTLRALHHAHEAGVLHRDVKPENILLADGIPRLTDFGIAYLRDSTGATSTSITASWLHTAPETFDNQRDERSDVYSAASTLFNLIAGRAPFENPDDESLNPLMRRLINDAPPPLPAGTAPAALSVYVTRALAKDPDERPASAAEMADGLQVILDSGGLKLPLGGGTAEGANELRPATPDPGPGKPAIPDVDPVPPPAGDTRSVPQQPLPAAPSLRSAPSISGRTPYPPNGAALPAPPPAGAMPPPSSPPPGPAGVQAPPGYQPAGYGAAPPAGFAPPAAPQAPIGNRAAPHQPTASPQLGAAPVVAPAVAARSGGVGRTMLLVLAGGTAFVIIAAIAGIALLRAGEAGIETAQTDAARVSGDEPEPPAPAPIGEDAEASLVEQSGFDPSDRPPVVLPAFAGPAGTIAELEDRWAQNRAAVVTALSADGYGIDDDNVLHGPGGFVADLNDCPADWSDTTGVESGTIRIGQTIAQSGSLASYSNLSSGMEAYFDTVNDRGGIGGRSIELVIRDDGYDPARTTTEVQDLLAGDDVFAITTLGSPNTLATYDQLNQACVPQPFAATSHPGLADPVDHPFTTPIAMTWGTEAVLWGRWIEENLADQLPVRVAAVVMDNDFGVAYSQPFASWAADHPEVIAEFVTVAHDPTAAGLDGEMAEVAAADADVFIAMTAGNACGLAMLGGERGGLSAETRFVGSVCRDPGFLSAAGQAADGYRALSGGQLAATDPSLAEDPYIAFVNESLEAARYDTSVALYGSGFGFYGWTWVETLRIAEELPGGLTRSNFLLAARGMQLVHPMVVDGVPFAMAGTVDPHYIESSDVGTFDAAAQEWIAGPIIAAEGETPACSWIEGSGCSG